MSLIERALAKQRGASSAPAIHASPETPAVQQSPPPRVPENTQPELPALEVPATAMMAARAPAAGAWTPYAEEMRNTDDALQGAGLLASPEFRGQHMSQYRSVRRLLLDRMQSNAAESGARSRSLAVTSALPGEGKTFTSYNLARSLSHDPNHKVLLIDGDLARRTLSRTLDAGHREGLAECLMDPTLDPRSLAAPMGERFSLLPAGRRYVEACERLASSTYATSWTPCSQPIRT